MKTILSGSNCILRPLFIPRGNIHHQFTPFKLSFSNANYYWYDFWKCVCVAQLKQISQFVIFSNCKQAHSLNPCNTSVCSLFHLVTSHNPGYLVVVYNLGYHTLPPSFWHVYWPAFDFVVAFLHSNWECPSKHAFFSHNYLNCQNFTETRYCCHSFPFILPLRTMSLTWSWQSHLFCQILSYYCTSSEWECSVGRHAPGTLSPDFSLHFIFGAIVDVFFSKWRVGFGILLLFCTLPSLVSSALYLLCLSPQVASQGGKQRWSSFHLSTTKKDSSAIILTLNHNMYNLCVS